MKINDLSIKNTLLIIAAALAMGMDTESFAVPANDKVYSIKQPDGTVIQVRKKGDEKGSWIETKTDQRTIAKGLDGVWKYVQSYNGKSPILSNYKVANVSPKSLGLEGKLDSHPIDTVPSFNQNSLNEGPLNPSVLYILVDYVDAPATYTNIADWSKQIYANAADSKTIADYYQEASYGAVNIAPAQESHGTTNDGVIGWLRLSGKHPVNREISGSADMVVESVTIAKEAILAADPYIDYAAYDLNHDSVVSATELALVIVVAGHEAGTPNSGLPNIWAHANLFIGFIETSDTSKIYETECTPVSPNLTSKPGYTGPKENCTEVLVSEYPAKLTAVVEMGEIHESSHKATLGVAVHELGHLIFGLPDLYDAAKPGYGLGGFSLMGSGTWGRDLTIDQFDGETPVLPDAWSQYKLQWVDGQAWGPLISTGRNVIPALKPAVGIAHVGTEFLPNLWTCSELEYFLMQYRTETGYDKGLSRFLEASFNPGLLILHVDETQNTNTTSLLNNKRMVEVEEANAIQVGEGTTDFLTYNNHLWYTTNATLFDDTSIPNSRPNGSASFPASKSSGVDIEVLNSYRASNGDEKISLHVNSACDQPKLTPSKL